MAHETMETEAVMPMNLHKFAITAVFTLTCFTVPVLTASAAARPATSGTGTTDDGKSGSDDPTLVQVTPDWTRGPVAEEVKTLQLQFRQQQRDLLQKYQDL